MNLKRIVNRKLYMTIISLVVLNLALLFGTRIYGPIMEIVNQRKINAINDYIETHREERPDGSKLLLPALKFKSLSMKQKAYIYTQLSIDYYYRSQLADFFNSVSYAIFYCEQIGDIEQVIYLYSLLSQYYLSIGADKSGFETILTAYQLKNFYEIEDIPIKDQALHAYGRYLLDKKDYENALKIQKQMVEDANILMQNDYFFGMHTLRRALCFKSYILMMQGKAEEAYLLAEETLNKYFSKDEELSHLTVYDFLLPAWRVKTLWALHNQDYKKALEFNKEYGLLAHKYSFIMKTTLLTREVLTALPLSMVKERTELTHELAVNSEILVQTYLDDYTGVTAKNLNSSVENLRYTAERENSKRYFLQTSLVLIVIFLLLILLLVVIYSETQVDGLTKLRNRRALNIRVGKLASSEKRYSAIMIDIDNFKKLNDTFGHAFGDEVLRTVASILIKNESHNVKCYRYGGEEMVIILEHFDLEHAVRLSEYIRNEISCLKWRYDVHVTASFGLGFEMPDSIKEADENMYVAKQKGKNFTAYRKDGTQYLAERRLDIRNPIPDV